MSERSTESSSTKLVPVIIQFESAFNLRIILTESNNVVWSQLMEMHIIEKENYPIHVGRKNHLRNPTIDVKNGMWKIKRSRGG